MIRLSLIAIAVLFFAGAAQAQPHRCGGVGGLLCPAGETCRMTGEPYPDQMGVCESQRGCPRIYRPVCGADRHTYANACLARRADVEVAHTGRCRAIVCPYIYLPVCGVNGVTYGNDCQARAAGVRIAHPGRCRR